MNFENFGKNCQINFEEAEKSYLCQKIDIWILIEYSNVKSTTATLFTRKTTSKKVR